MKTKKAIKLIEDKLPEKRYKHSLRVAETAKKLAEIHDGDLLNVLGLQEFFDKIAVDQHHDRLRYTAFRL